jgi:predicted aspartyl protease
MFWLRFALSVCLLFASLLTSIANSFAQSLSGVRIGDDLSNAVQQVGFPPDKTDRSGPFIYSMWTLGDGNELHVTTRTGEGKIVYMESDWGGWLGDRGSSETDFRDFFFGRTTRQRIISKMGSRGILYEGRFLFSVQADRSSVFDTIYDVSGANVIVDFVTRIDETGMRLRVRDLTKRGTSLKFKSDHLGDPGVLIAIIVGERDYIDNHWGQRVAAENYRPIAPELLEPRQEIRSASKKTDEVRLLLRNGVSFVSVKINDRLILDFVVDSGAADVQIPDDVFRTLLRTGTISRNDFLGTETYFLADGTKVPSDRYLLRKMEVGDHIVANVVASIGDRQSELLLGQSFLSKFGSWMLDNNKHVLILTNK